MEDMSVERTVHLRIRGRVQGVFFRANARDRAEELGIRGWVRNRPDGTVEAIASGDDDSVEAFIGWCGEGSTAARVDRVEVEPSEETAPEGSFEIRR